MTDYEFQARVRPRIGLESPSVSGSANTYLLPQEDQNPRLLAFTRIVGAVTALITTISAFLALLMVILLLTNEPINSSSIWVGNKPVLALFSFAGVILWALVYRLLILALRRLGRSTSSSVNSRVPASGIAASAALNPPPSPEQEWMHREALLRYTVIVIIAALLVLGVAMILFQYDQLVYKFLIFAPLILPFPFSYLAYAAFQGRKEEVKRDFVRMGVVWDDARYEQRQGFWNFALHVALAMLVTAAGITLFFWTPPSTVDPKLLDPLVIQPLRYGFIGGYLFSVWLIYRRYTTRDLQPAVYLYSALTILAGVAFNYVAFQAILNIGATESTSGLGSGLVNILAFALGFFPLLAVQWMTRVAYAAFGVTNRRAEALPLSLIDGISTFHETRLHDKGIDNVENLAAVDIPTLLIDTTFDTQEVIDWVDQAILYLYLVPAEIDSFGRGKIRTVSDFRDWWSGLYQDTSVSPDPNAPLQVVRKNNAQQLQSTPEQLDALYRATENGLNLTYILNYWTNIAKEATNFYSSQYTSVLEDVLFLTSSDDDKSKLTDNQKWADQISGASSGKAIAKTGQGRAGLARLLLEQIAAAPPPPQDTAKVEQAVVNSLLAIKLNEQVRLQTVADLKGITDAQMSIVEEFVKEADTLAGAEQQAKLQDALNMTQKAVEWSRNSYPDKSCNISYECRLADLEYQTGAKDKALIHYREALENMKKVEAYSSTEKADSTKPDPNADKHKADREKVEEKIKKIETEMGVAGSTSAPSPAAPALVPSATITAPVEGTAVTGSSISVSGTAGGFPEEQISLLLIDSSGMTRATQIFSLPNPHDVPVEWNTSLVTNAYTGDAEIRVVVVRNTEQIQLASIKVNLQP